MIRNKKIGPICLAVAGFAVLLTLLLMNGEAFGLKNASSQPPYASRLFDTGRVHSINIVTEKWDALLANPSEEKYVACSVVIDGEKFSHIGLRFKGNNSLSLTEKYGHERYSMKLEFDHFAPGSYYGLDKLSLDASFQDNSYLKTYLSFDMMRYMQVPTPLCSYAWVTVNGEDHGLFLAVEEPEEAFARRNFGPSFGELYKPDYKSLDDENADIALKYIDEDPKSYDNIFRNAKFDPSEADKTRLISALKTLSEGVNFDKAIHVDEVLRYFTVQVFVVNLDSYLGKTGHNYFLYEEDGTLSILPWDYNLAFATYSLGMPEPINDAELYVNYPINTPASGEVMKNRPLYHNLMKNDDCFAQYHAYFNELISGYFESGGFEHLVKDTVEMIAPYVEKDPTAFCSYEDFILGADTLRRFCLLRAESIRGQLDGRIPATIAGQWENKSSFVDASSIWLPDMGEIGDLKD